MEQQTGEKEQSGTGAMSVSESAVQRLVTGRPPTMRDLAKQEGACEFAEKMADTFSQIMEEEKADCTEHEIDLMQKFTAGVRQLARKERLALENLKAIVGAIGR
jgi:hypothetical protein